MFEVIELPHYGLLESHYNDWKDNADEKANKKGALQHLLGQSLRKGLYLLSQQS